MSAERWKVEAILTEMQAGKLSSQEAASDIAALYGDERRWSFARDVIRLVKDGQVSPHTAAQEIAAEQAYWEGGKT